MSSHPAFHQLALLLEEAIDSTLAKERQGPAATVTVVVEAEHAYTSEPRDDSFLLPAAHHARGEADPHGFLVQERGWSEQQKINHRMALFSAQLAKGRQGEGQAGSGPFFFEPLQPLPQEASSGTEACCQLCGEPLCAARPNRWRCDACAQALWLVLAGEVPAHLFGQRPAAGRLLAAPA